ncbi:hypothetical protein [Azospirillum picis]|uniref:Uncharacterized protein n=1 Tax=Azospirillum picis TaxID=488438 RepID=A0ABU0MRF5_9PROT|nr:hypothetical protein [Azospirillum picis]MBP2302220.1 hypothetical protein [Azospirillum picis]MDQ0535799.1 hypothetical protein [Azospirillum picis]
MATNKLFSIAAAAVLSVSALTLAAAPATATDFNGLLAETSAAAASANAITAERTERDAARIALSVARSLAAQGDTEAAAGYLNFARGKLGLTTVARGELVGLSASGDTVGRGDAVAPHTSYR